MPSIRRQYFLNGVTLIHVWQVISSFFTAVYPIAITDVPKPKSHAILQQVLSAERNLLLTDYLAVKLQIHVNSLLCQLYFTDFLTLCNHSCCFDKGVNHVIAIQKQVQIFLQQWQSHKPTKVNWAMKKNKNKIKQNTF